jgi:hypothetical protein
MAPTPPPFASASYWDARFHSNPSAFDWLQSASILDPHITAALQRNYERPTNILHIGCGTSLLSYHLRAHVDDAAQIHNVDFSQEAINLGKKREAEIFGPNGQEKEEQQVSTRSTEIVLDTSIKSTIVFDQDGQNAVKTASNDPSSRCSPSRWDKLDLLSLPSLRSVCAPASYTMVVEKSCSDAIACAEDIPITTPYPLTITRTSHNSSTEYLSSPSSSSPSSSIPPSPATPPSYYIHPVTLLAVHLAALAIPSARWVCLSYSSGRFPFLLPSDATSDPEAEGNVPRELLEQGFPDPAALWRLERQEEVEATEEDDGGKVVHRPRVVHWVYVLERTEVSVSGGW